MVLLLSSKAHACFTEMQPDKVSRGFTEKTIIVPGVVEVQVANRHRADRPSACTIRPIPGDNGFDLQAYIADRKDP